MSSESPDDQVAGGTDTADAPSDAALLDAVRDGDADAFDVVYRRHVDAARRLARVLAADQAAADDLVAESFARLLTTLKSGGGPESAVRAYVLTTMRRVHIDSGRAGSKVEPVEEVADYERPESPDDPAVSKLDQAYAAQAFAGLPERWQAVLWHIEVEGESPAEVAPLLGLNPNAVSAIAYRAREQLRQLYLQQHLATVEGEECSWCSERLGAYVRDKLGSRESGRVREHLDECDKCRIIYLDLVEVNSGFRFLLAPVVLGSAAVPYLAAAGKSIGLFGLLPAAWAWWKNASKNPATAVAATVVLVMALGVTAWATVGNRLADDGGSRTAQSSQPTGVGGTGGATADSSSEPSSSTSKVAETKSEPPTSPPTSEPTSSRPPATSEEPPDEPEPATEPTTEPATEPTSSRPPPETSDSPKPPTTEPTEEPTTPEPEPTETVRPVCVRIPILKICLGDNQTPSAEPSELPSRGNGRP
ncbi:MAG: sigma-70 family RNA polymerase sigma factor [Streptosporangiales bacterium]|nr:sigma-70 family RNA polymerase sigma factor [Streptosporangiales bacterium]